MLNYYLYIVISTAVEAGMDVKFYDFYASLVRPCLTIDQLSQGHACSWEATLCRAPVYHGFAWLEPETAVHGSSGRAFGGPLESLD